MVTEPGGEGRLIKVASGQCEHGGHNLGFGCIDAEAVKAEKEIHGLEGDALVAVDEGVVLREAEAIGGGKGSAIGALIVDEEVSRALKCRLEEGPIA